VASPACPEVKVEALAAQGQGPVGLAQLQAQEEDMGLVSEWVDGQHPLSPPQTECCCQQGMTRSSAVQFQGQPETGQATGGERQTHRKWCCWR